MAVLGLLGLAIYALVIPVVLFKRLLRESRDEAEERFDPDFMESHGWLVRHRYRHLLRCGGNVRLLLTIDRCSLREYLAGPAVQALEVVVCKYSCHCVFLSRLPLAGGCFEYVSSAGISAVLLQGGSDMRK